MIKIEELKSMQQNFSPLKPLVKQEETEFAIHKVEKEPKDQSFDDSLSEALWPKPVKSEPDALETGTQVLLLSELGSNRSERFCRTMKYKLKSSSKAEDGGECHGEFNKRHREKHLSSKGSKNPSDVQTCDQSETVLAGEDNGLSKAKKHICNLCGTAYAFKGYLRVHMRVHTGETPYRCPICEKAFRRSDWLADHVRAHNGQKRPRRKRYLCEQCPRVFENPSELKNHQNWHTGERPHQCHLCGKRFFRKNELNTHQMNHFGEKPFTCTDCGKGFGRSDTLQKHRRIHTGEKPYSCTLCGKHLRYSYSLKLHLKIHETSS